MKKAQHGFAAPDGLLGMIVQPNGVQVSPVFGNAGFVASYNYNRSFARVQAHRSSARYNICDNNSSAFPGKVKLLCVSKPV